MANEEKADELYARFQETDEMLDWDDFVIKTRDALDADPNADAVTVPAPFLRRVLGDIAATPLMFPAYRDRHNQLCDELGIPEEKRKG